MFSAPRGQQNWNKFYNCSFYYQRKDEYKKIIKPDAPAGTKVLLDVGDMLVYSGCELEHWREPFDGNICGQVFLHYNHVNGPFADKNRFDGRPMLGLPSFVK